MVHIKGRPSPTAYFLPSLSRKKNTCFADWLHRGEGMIDVFTRTGEKN